VVDGPAPAPWRGIDELAALVGAYCWLEQRIFAITGAWATRHPSGVEGAGADADALGGSGLPELRVWCAATSQRHAALAARWAERLPVRAGVDRDALIAAPAGPLAAGLDELASETDLCRGVTALVQGLLPGLDAIYGAHRRTASPVREGSVLEVLAGAHREVAAEIRGGRSLIEGFGAAHPGPDGHANFAEFFERLLNGTRVFPAVRTS